MKVMGAGEQRGQAYGRGREVRECYCSATSPEMRLVTLSTEVSGNLVQ